MSAHTAPGRHNRTLTSSPPQNDAALDCRITRDRASSSACFSFVFDLGMSTFGAECRVTGAFQTLRWHAAKVAV
jgi:hypothetical protein